MASGQSINFQKSHILFSKHTPINLKHELLSKFHMQELLLSDRYLGLSVFLECSRQQALTVVEERTCSKPQAWKQKLLS